MKCNYLLECSDLISLEEKIQELISTCGFLDDYQATYDLEDTLLESALEDLNTYGLFSEKKVIVIKNLFHGYMDKKLDELLHYIDHYDQNNLLILTTDKLDQRLNIVKKMKKNMNMEVVSIKLDPIHYAQKILQGYQISSSDLQFLVNLCGKDITRIHSECNKLMSYKYKSMKINQEDIEEIVVKKLGDSSETLFSFTRYLMLKDKKNAYQTYLELLNYQMDVYSIIGLMASQIKLTHQVKLLSDNHMSNQEIANELHLKSTYQVKKIKEYIPYYTYNQIYDFVKKLASIDLDIKSGRVDSSLALDLLIVNL